ncbi:hypothetical protein LguiB_031844 [Lonicera macranthoides]
MDDSKLFTGAFISEIRNVFREVFDPVHEQLDKVCKSLDRVEKTQVKLSHNDPNGRRIQSRKYKVENDWDPGIANMRYDSRFKEGRVRDDNNMCSIKKNTSLNDPEDWHKLEKMMEAYLEFNMMGCVVSNPIASSCESNQCNEASKDQQSCREASEEKKEGERKEKKLSENLKETEEIVDQSQEQVELEHGKQVLRQDFGEFSKMKMEVDEVDHIDFLEWTSRISIRAKQQPSRCELNQTMLSQDSRTNLLEEEGYDVIQLNLPFNSIQEYYEFLNEGLNTHRFKDRAWKFKIKKAGVGKLEEFKIILFYILKLVSCHVLDDVIAYIMHLVMSLLTSCIDDVIAYISF